MSKRNVNPTQTLLGNIKTPLCNKIMELREVSLVFRTLQRRNHWYIDLYEPDIQE